MDTDFNKEFLEVVKKKLPKGMKLLYLSLTGSRSKNLDSPDSDFDFKAIVINDIKTYLLQEVVSPLKANPTFYKGFEVEGQIIDLYTAGQLALDTSPFIREMIRSPVIYEESPEIMKVLKEIYDGAYNLFRPLSYLNSQFKLYMGKGPRDENDNYNKSSPVKFLVEVFHIVLSLRSFYAGKEQEGYYVMDELFQFGGKDEELIRNLVKIRREKKNTEIEMTDEIKAILNEAETLVKQELKKRKNKGEPPEITAAKETQKHKVNELFFKYALPYVHEQTRPVDI